MKTIFLGTNGWFTTKTGNTTCILIDSKDYYIVLDAGNGIYKLDKYIKENKQIYLFISHFHADHISGLQMLSLFRFRQGLKIYIQKNAKQIFNIFMNLPFTFALDKAPYKIEVNEITEGEHLIPFKVTAKKLEHPVPCFGYRFELDGKIIAYATDTAVCDNDLKLAQNADLLIHECANPPSDMLSNNGHSAPYETAKLAKDANVKKLVLMHFAANVYTTLVQRKNAENRALEVFKKTTASYDDMEMEL